MKEMNIAKQLKLIQSLLPGFGMFYLCLFGRTGGILLKQ